MMSEEEEVAVNFLTARFEQAAMEHLYPCPHPKELSDTQILEICDCGALLILRSGSMTPEWHI